MGTGLLVLAAELEVRAELERDLRELVRRERLGELERVLPLQPSRVRGRAPEGSERDGKGWDWMGWDGMGWDGMGWDRMGWDGAEGMAGRQARRLRPRRRRGPMRARMDGRPQ